MHRNYDIVYKNLNKYRQDMNMLVNIYDRLSQ